MVFSAFESVPSVYLGLSYPVWVDHKLYIKKNYIFRISSTMSIVVFVGMLVAAFLVPYAIHVNIVFFFRCAVRDNKQ